MRFFSGSLSAGFVTVAVLITVVLSSRFGVSERDGVADAVAPGTAASPSPGIGTPGAMFSVSDGAAHSVGEAFDVTVSLSDAHFDQRFAYWASYDVELDFDPAVLSVVYAESRSRCPPGVTWVIADRMNHVAGMCGFRRSTTASTPLLEVRFRCRADGWSELGLPRLPTRSIGNDLSNDAAGEFPMTLRGSSVTCGTGMRVPAPSRKDADATREISGLPGAQSLLTSVPRVGSGNVVGPLRGTSPVATPTTP
jgi:hypothetical protein